jgi:hypothetical protein
MRKAERDASPTTTPGAGKQIRPGVRDRGYPGNNAIVPDLHVYGLHPSRAAGTDSRGSIDGRTQEARRRA